jgi:enterochelin esterase-like enzyme
MLPRIVPEVTAKDASAASATAANSNTASTSSADVQAKAFGTAIPDNKEPAVPASASDPPRVQDTASNVAQPDSNAAGKLQGTLLEPEFYSTALNTQERYFIYLPPGYHNQGQKLPVLYMLHGAGGRGEWLGYDLIGKADAGIASGKLPQMLIVLPQGDDGYWVNHQSGGPKWGDYLIQDLVKHIDSTYRTQPDAKHRALGGMSMGGWGALYQGFTHPEEFGVVGAHAAALRQDLPFLPKGDQFNQFDPVQLAANAPNLTSQRVWIDADEQDPWVKRDADVHNRLDTRHISNEWHTFPGRHGGSYWADHVPDYLNFYGKALSGS